MKIVLVYALKIVEKRLINYHGYSKGLILPKGWLMLNEVDNRVILLMSKEAPRILIVLPEEMSPKEIIKQFAH